MNKWMMLLTVMLLAACGDKAAENHAAQPATAEKLVYAEKYQFADAADAKAFELANRIRARLQGLMRAFEDYMQGVEMPADRLASWDDKVLAAYHDGKEILVSNNNNKDFEVCGEAAYYANNLKNIMVDGSTLGAPSEDDKETYQKFRARLQGCKDAINNKQSSLKPKDGK